MHTVRTYTVHTYIYICMRINCTCLSISPEHLLQWNARIYKYCTKEQLKCHNAHAHIVVLQLARLLKYWWLASKLQCVVALKCDMYVNNVINAMKMPLIFLSLLAKPLRVEIISLLSHVHVSTYIRPFTSIVMITDITGYYVYTLQCLYDLLSSHKPSPLPTPSRCWPEINTHLKGLKSSQLSYACVVRISRINS